VTVLIVIVVLVLLGLALMLMYNGLVKLRNRTENAWSQVDVQLRRRYDLIPNLVETVKGYASHEERVFQEVTEARARAQGAQGVEEQGAAERQLTAAIGGLFAVAENYPQLRASENFQQLQSELGTTENKIAVARQVYNDTIQTYNTKVETVPTNIVAGAFNFSRKPFFELDESAAREAPRVAF
jgi:LemA protein